MSDGFNGYREWLEIDTHGALMSFYRLLDLPEFESDVGRIEFAAGFRIELLEPHMVGAHRQVAGRIINEILEAKRCLCDPELKAVYDAKIRELNGAIPTPPEKTTPQTNGVHAHGPATPSADEFFATVNGAHLHSPANPAEPVSSTTLPSTPVGDLAGDVASQPIAPTDATSTESATAQEESSGVASPTNPSSDDDDLYGVAGTPSESTVSAAATGSGVTAKRVATTPIPPRAPQPEQASKTLQLSEIWKRLEPHHQNLRYAGLAVALLLLAGFAAYSLSDSSAELQAQAIVPQRIPQLSTPPAAPLMFTPLPRQVAREHQELIVPLSVTNGTPTSGPVRFMLLDSPPSEMFVDQQGALHWTPSEEDGGRSVIVRIRATVGSQFTDANLDIQVEEVNTPPVVLAVNDQLVEPGQEAYVQLSATDTDLPMQPITFEMLGGPRTARLDKQTGVLRFQVPPQDAGREHLFVVRARDGVGVSTQQQFVLRVKPGKNTPPAATVAQQKPPKQPVVKTVPPKPEKVRHPIPEQVAIQAADKLFRETFERDLERATSNEAKSQFAVKLLEQASRLTDVPAEMYVLLKAAADLAVEGGSAPVAAQAAQLLAKHFDLELHLLRAELIKALASGRDTRSTADQARLVESAIDTVKLSIAADDLKVAQDMTLLAVRVANSANNSELLKQSNEIKKEILILRRQFPGLDSALVAAEHPEALPTTYAQAGSWLCLVRGNWQHGLPILVQGDDATLKLIASAELEKPADPMQQVSLADRWWEQAEVSRGVVRWQLRRRAAHWYKTAQPNVQGLVKQKLAIRIEEAGADTENPLAVAPTDRKSIASKPKEVAAADSRDFKIGGTRNLLQVLATDEKFSAAGFGRQKNEFASLAAGAKLPLPAIIDRNASYEVDLEFSMNGAGQTGLAVILPLGKNSGAVVLTTDKYRGLTQLLVVNKQQGPSNPTATKGRLKARKRTRCHIKVQTDEADVRVLVTIDGTPVIDWRGSQSSISSHKTVRLANSEQLGIWAGEPGVVFHRVHFTLRGGDSSKPR